MSKKNSAVRILNTLKNSLEWFVGFNKQSYLINESEQVFS